MGSVRRSLAYLFAGNWVVAGLQLVGTLFLARLLTPAETGVWAVAAVFAAVAGTLRDFGLTEYVIQEKDLTTAKLRAVFSANLIVSWLIAAAFVLASGAVAGFYGEPGIARVMRVQALSYLLVPFGAVTFAWFRRSLDYRPFFFASILAALGNLGVAIPAAFAGLGYMSLAWASLAGVVVSVAAALWLMPKEFPRLPGLEGIGPVLRFGRHAIGIHVFGQIGRHAPEIVIGRALGMAPVGFFNRANGLNELFNRAVLRAAGPLCLPYFAAEVRHGRELRAVYAGTLASLTAVGWPALVLLALLAFPAIRVLYGEQWDASVPLARLLCIAAAVEITYWLATEALIAGGKVRAGHSLQVWRQCARIAGLLAGVPFGLVGACWGLLAGAIAGSVLSHRALVAHIGLSLRLVAAACARSFAIVAISTGPTALWALAGRIDENNYVVVAAACVTSFCILWPVSLRLLGHPLWAELWKLRRRRDLT